MGIGQRIKEARINKKLTQEQLAALLEVSKGTIGNYESEISHPKEPIMYKLFDVLGVDANFLFQDEMKMTAPVTAPNYSPDTIEVADAYAALPSDDAKNMIRRALTLPDLKRGITIAKNDGLGQKADTVRVFVAAMSDDNRKMGYTNIPRSDMEKLRNGSDPDEL